MKRAREALVNVGLADVRTGNTKDFLRSIPMVRKNTGCSGAPLHTAAVAGEIEPIRLSCMTHDKGGLIIGRTMRQVEPRPQHVGNGSMAIARAIDIEVRIGGSGPHGPESSRSEERRVGKEGRS